MRHFLPYLLSIALALATTTTTPPNFVFLLSESLDGRLLREDSPAHIPNIRALLSSGSVRFDGAFSNNPVCAPSRSSLFSGRAPHKIPHEHNGFLVGGAWNNYEGLAPTYDTRLDQLLATPQWGSYAINLQGKTDWTAGSHTESNRLECITFNVDWPYNITAEGGWNLEGDFCSSPGPVSPGGSGGSSGSVYPGDWKITEATAAFITAAALNTTPFFAYLGTSILHPPYATSQYWYDIAATRPNPVWPPLQSLHPCDLQAAMKHGCTPSDASSPDFHDPARIERVRRVYLAELEEYDAMVGRVVAALKASGQLDNTWVVLGADHGDMQLEHQMFYKMVPYDPSARVPLIFAHPSLGAAAVVAQPTQLLDIFPTLLTLANPTQALPPYTDGHDLGPFLRGSPSDPSRPPFVAFQCHDTDISMSWFGVFNGTHKLVVYGSGGEGIPPQVFDTLSDPGETVNLAPTLPAGELAALDAALRSLVDYPSVAMDVALYQKQQLRFWVNATGAGWEQEVVNQRWEQAWKAAPDRAMMAFKSYLTNDTIAIQPCNGALVN